MVASVARISAAGSPAREMSCIEGLLRKTALEFEPELQNRLKGIFGGIISGYLPQAWVFQTEDGAASLLVDKAGKVSVMAGVAPHPDVTVEMPHARLAAALKTRTKSAVPPGDLKVTPHTVKGRTAFDYLRGRLGL
jgi:hypothetical protein